MGTKKAPSGMFPIRDYPQATATVVNSGVPPVLVMAVRNHRNSFSSGFFSVRVGASVEKSSTVTCWSVGGFLLDDPCTDEMGWLLIRSLCIAVFYL